jgi:Zn-dependent M28 family amino/carboxypeptidase
MHRFLVVLLLLPIAACAREAPRVSGLSAERLLADIAVLASDSLEGRKPGTRGEEKTVAFLVAQFEAAGLEPGNPDGTWTQLVDLVGITSAPAVSITVRGTPLPLRWRDDYVAVSRRTAARVTVDPSEMVFVGYGVVAPEYGWDDYKDVDVAGKTVVMLVNDPAIPAEAGGAVLDSTLFRGDAMTYYGRWTYKYEIATARGAAAVLVIHEDGPAGYPWEVVRGGWSGERMDLRAADDNAGWVAVEGWITSDVARALFTTAGHDFGQLKLAATSADFRPVTLDAQAAFTVAQQLRDIRSRNVVGRLPGSDPALAGEHVIYTAHWDHFGIGEPVEGDSIYNGARDNATGTAALLELARGFAEAGAPGRSILFLAVTAEENGLLGSRWYVEHPLYPLATTLANLNVDVLNTWGPTRDITVVGMGNTSLEDVLRDVAAEQGRSVTPDPEPGKGFFYRSDHFEFAKQGVPALYLDEGTDYIGKPANFGAERRADYTARVYHKPADEVDPGWDLAGAIADLQLLSEVGRRVADAETWPTWKDGTEFKAVRERMLEGGR